MLSPITAAYQGELRRIRAAVAARVGANWDRLPDYKDKQIPGFLEASLPIVKAGQSRAIALTSAYTAKKLGFSPVGLDTEAIISNIRGGVDPAIVYRRPFETVWSSIYTIGIAAAAAKGLARLQATAEMDLAMAGRDSLLSFGRDSGGEIIGWTRVAEAGGCDFCQSIDGAHTGPNEPQPLHNRCGCTADPITRSSGFNGSLLTVGAVIGSAVISQHGELGPVIGAEGENFDGPDDLDAPQPPPRTP